MSEAAMHNSAIASGAAFGGGGGQPPNSTSFPHLFCMMFGFNPSGAAKHDLGLNHLAIGSSLIPHRQNFFAKRLFSLNSKSKGVSPSQLAPDAKLKQNGSGISYNS